MIFAMDVLDMAGLWTGAIGLQIIIGVLFFFWNLNRTKVIKPKAIDEQKLIDWRPLPLVEENVIPQDTPVMGKISEGIYNMGATSFLSLHNLDKIEDESIAALHKYGVGSCGPRGFYGTIDVHLTLEERLAKFMGVEEACVYSYGFSTIASAIPAYAKKGDLIFADECVNFAIQKGIDASRSNVKYFRHNDMAHLEELLIASNDRLTKKRSFIIVEGIYFNVGTLCPLPQLVELRKKYKLRMILDESLTIGVIGKEGRGLTEYFKIPVGEVDLIVGSLEHSFGTIGGFCVGSHFIVEHQRLSGLGYCFSASLPPLLTQAAISALDVIESDTSCLSKLRENSIRLQRKLSESTKFRVGGHELSPIKHLYIKEDVSISKKQSCLKKITEYCREHGIALPVSAYLRDAEVKSIEPSIRVASNSQLTNEQIEKLVVTLNEASISLDFS